MKYIFLKGKIFNGHGYTAGDIFEASPDAVKVLSENSYREATDEDLKEAAAPKAVAAVPQKSEAAPSDEEKKGPGRPKKSD